MGLLSAAYFDASGKQKGYSFLTVAGAVSPIKKWIRFEKQWMQALNDEGVTQFHATDFAASQGEYEAWKGDKQRQNLGTGEQGISSRREFSFCICTRRV
jgi:hypothetical protein